MKDRGKIFEREFRDSFADCVSVRIRRIKDSVMFNGQRMVGNPTDGDFYLWLDKGPLHSFLIENKAVNGKSLPQSRLEQHQHDSLADFDSFSPFCHGVIAINFYDSKAIRKFNQVFLVPIEEWDDFFLHNSRKSIPIGECQNNPKIIECPRIKGSKYDIIPFVSSY